MKIYFCLRAFLLTYLPTCLCTCVFACLPACLSLYLSAYLSIYLLACLPAYLSVCLSVCLSICMFFCLSVYLFVCFSVCLSVCYVGLFCYWVEWSNFWTISKEFFRMNFTEFLFKHYWILKNVYNKLHEVTYSTALYDLKDTIIQLYITIKTDKKRDLQKNWQKDGKLQVLIHILWHLTEGSLKVPFYVIFKSIYSFHSFSSVTTIIKVSSFKWERFSLR